MTTEIAVLNREAVALAADSAITFQERGAHTPAKIHTSANKIFALSGPQPVGITVYESAARAGIPWEVIIKLFRRDLGDAVEASLEGYEQRLTAFLGTERFIPVDDQRRFVERQAGDTFAKVFVDARSAILAHLTGPTGLTVAEVQEIIVGQFRDQITDEQSVPAIHLDHATGLDSFVSRYSDITRAVLTTVFGNLPLSDPIVELAGKLLGERLLRRNRLEPGAGIVIAGFGDDDLLPRLRHLRVEGVVDGRARAWEASPPWDVATQGAQIIPFAQDDMVSFFLSGVSPDYQTAVESAIATILTEYPDELVDAVPGLEDSVKGALRDARDKVSPARLGDVLAKLAAYRHAQFTQDILTVVASLPKDQLASLAEALVNLTSLRRRMSTKAETVGGPVDVAVISKGDGLVWVSRKHYFDPALNPRYFENTYRR